MPPMRWFGRLPGPDHNGLISLIFCRLFHPPVSDETILLGDETIFRFWRRRPETADGYQYDNENGGQRRWSKPETVKCEP